MLWRWLPQMVITEPSGTITMNDIIQTSSCSDGLRSQDDGEQAAVAPKNRPTRINSGVCTLNDPTMVNMIHCKCTPCYFMKHWYILHARVKITFSYMQFDMNHSKMYIKAFFLCEKGWFSRHHLCLLFNNSLHENLLFSWVISWLKYFTPAHNF